MSLASQPLSRARERRPPHLSPFGTKFFATDLGKTLQHRTFEKKGKETAGVRKKGNRRNGVSKSRPPAENNVYFIQRYTYSGRYTPEIHLQPVKVPMAPFFGVNAKPPPLYGLRNLEDPFFVRQNTLSLGCVKREREKPEASPKTRDGPDSFVYGVNRFYATTASENWNTGGAALALLGAFGKRNARGHAFWRALRRDEMEMQSPKRKKGLTCGRGPSCH